MLYEFKLSHNGAEATKNIRWAKSEAAVDQSTVTKWLIAQSAGAIKYTDYTSAEG